MMYYDDKSSWIIVIIMIHDCHDQQHCSISPVPTIVGTNRQMFGIKMNIL